MQNWIPFFLLFFLFACQQSGPNEGDEIHFQSGDLTLKGTLSMPEGKPPFPTMVFVHGSGALVLLPLSSFRPILDLFAHIFVAPQSRSEGYAPSSRLDLNKNILRLF